jgi:O-antigen biosynthesis protein
MNWAKTIGNLTIVRNVVRACRLLSGTVSLAIHNPTRACLSIRNGLLLLKQHGFKEFIRSTLQAHSEWSGLLERGYRPPVQFAPPAEVDSYEVWLEVNAWNDRWLRHLTERLQAASDTLPRITIIVVVSAPSTELFLEMLSSVKSQVFQDWELCVVRDCSSDSDVRQILAEWEATDERIRVISVEGRQQAAAATQDVVSAATGEFLAFVGQHDELTPDALAEIVLYIASHSETDFVYSDNDSVDVDGRRHSPQFKPDWSPELLISHNYCDHLVAVRRSLFLKLQGLCVQVDLGQDYDFALRATELARHVGHVPLILYHRRQPPVSPTLQVAQETHNDRAATRALRSAFQRRGIKASPYRLQEASDATIPVYSHEFPDNGPSVGIVISNRNPESGFGTCLQSLAKTTYENYETFVLNRGGELVSAETCSCSSTGHEHTTVIDDSSVNWAELLNTAAKQLHTDYVLFLDASLTIAEPRWLSQMIGCAEIENVATVGARIVSQSRTILDAGVVLKAGHGMPDYAFRGAADNSRKSSWAKALRNCSAVSGACMATRRQIFTEMGGFDHERFPRGYYDFDYCLRLWDRGFRTVCSPGAKLVYEGSGYGLTEKDAPEERAKFREKYRSHREHYYSQHYCTSPPIFQVSPRKLIRGHCNPIRTLICTHALDLTGAPYYLLDLVVSLHRSGVIDGVVSSPQDGPLRADFERAGITVHLHEMPDNYTSGSGDYEAAISRFTNYVRTLDCGMVYASTLRSWYAIESARRAALPSIWSVRESEPWQGYYDYLPGDIEKLALECFSQPYRVIFTADSSRDVWAALDSRHSFMVILDGLDQKLLASKNQGLSRAKVRESLNVKPDELAVLLLGTVCARKGQHDLARALAKLPAHFRERLRCFIVGDRSGSYSTELKRIVAELPPDLRDRVSIVPETPDTARYYLAADLFVCTSRVESYPRVILEAMAYGLPIVTTPVLGIRQQVRPEFNALFYEPDNPTELAERLETLIADDALRRRFAANSTHVLNGLIDFDEMVESYADVFREAYFSKGRFL